MANIGLVPAGVVVDIGGGGALRPEGAEGATGAELSVCVAAELTCSTAARCTARCATPLLSLLEACTFFVRTGLWLDPAAVRKRPCPDVLPPALTGRVLFLARERAALLDCGVRFRDSLWPDLVELP